MQNIFNKADISDLVHSSGTAGLSVKCTKRDTASENVRTPYTAVKCIYGEKAMSGRFPLPRSLESIS